MRSLCMDGVIRGRIGAVLQFLIDRWEQNGLLAAAQVAFVKPFLVGLFHRLHEICKLIKIHLGGVEG